MYRIVELHAFNVLLWFGLSRRVNLNGQQFLWLLGRLDDIKLDEFE